MAGSSRCFSTLVAFAFFLRLPTKCLASSLQNACDNGTSFSLVYWEQKPYIYKDEGDNTINGALPEILRRIFKACCKTDANISAKLLKYPASMKTTIQNHTREVIIPVGRRVGRQESIFMRPFLGLIDSPGMAVVVQKTIPGEELMAAIFDAWPILIFIGMAVSLSAIVMWVLDHRSNTDEFPKFFPSGVFEAFWWAAVTMTTVGYGDKVPRSVAGRLFCVVWINLGLVILAIFMGMITASLSSNSLEQINNLYGMPVAVMNGSAEQQLAILQNAEVHAKTSYEDLYKSVKSEETRVALVDLYSTTQHSKYYNKYTLYVATVLNEPVVYGAVLPMGSEAARNCFLSYTGNHQLEMHEIVGKFIKTEKYHSDDSSLGVEYFEDNMFGYTVYGMLGLFIIALAVGLIWQHFPRAKKEHNFQTSTAEQHLQHVGKSESSHPGKHGDGQLSVNYPKRMFLDGSEQHTERVMTAHCTEILAMENELKAFRKNWDKNFRDLRERHKKEQEQLFGLDNFGYEM